ncbi:flagellar basal body rod protein FlgB [Silvimonas sp.]|nr:flagellar basal body rod protein FlgB [Silvimonas sp.]MDR3428397.1 flagellar basal body rod protein FlgB [Silvimonas sp.]
MSSLDSYFQTQETAMKLRGYRQEVLSSNIANGDTPQYKARDFDFSTAFKSALSASQVNAGTLAATDARHLQPQGTTDLFAPQLQYRSEVQPSIDGNTVDMNTEMRDFADNTLRYEASITFMQNRMSTMRTALTSASS